MHQRTRCFYQFYTGDQLTTPNRQAYHNEENERSTRTFWILDDPSHPDTTGFGAFHAGFWLDDDGMLCTRDLGIFWIPAHRVLQIERTWWNDDGIELSRKEIFDQAYLEDPEA